jgi:biotin synthase-like enzyme
MSNLTKFPPKKKKIKMSITTNTWTMANPHEDHNANFMTKFNYKKNHKDDDVSLCMIVVTKTCYLCQVLCGIVIKMCYIFYCILHNGYYF